MKMVLQLFLDFKEFLSQEKLHQLEEEAQMLLLLLSLKYLKQIVAKSILMSMAFIHLIQTKFLLQKK